VTSTNKHDDNNPVWKYFELVKVENVSVPFVNYMQCTSVLKWKSRDGTSSLSTHQDACSKRLPTATRRLSDLPLIQAAEPKVPSHVKSDFANALAWTCAKDIRKDFLKRVMN